MMLLRINQPEEQAIEQLRELARANPFDYATLEAASEATGGDLLVWKHKLDRFTILLPEGFVVTYTHEQHPDCLCQHLNISVLGDLPPLMAISVIGGLFGLVDDAGHTTCEILQTWHENYPNGQRSFHVLASLPENI